MNVIALLRTQAARLEAMSARYFRNGFGIADKDEVDTIRGEILDAVVEVERRAAEGPSEERTS